MTINPLSPLSRYFPLVSKGEAKALALPLCGEGLREGVSFRGNEESRSKKPSKSHKARPFTSFRVTMR